MKKILSVMLLAICFVIGINFADVSKANAEDIYIGTFKGGSGYTIHSYVDPDNFNFGGLVGPSGFSGFVDYYYEYDGKISGTPGIGMIFFYPHPSKGVWYVSGDIPADNMRDAHPLSRSSSLAQKIFNIVYPRLKNRDAEKAQKAAAEKARQEREQRLAEEKRRREEAERERNFNNLIAEGDKSYNVNDYGGAKNFYQKARNINNDKIEYYCDELIKNGDKLLKEKNFAAAVDYFRKAFIMGSNKSLKEFNGHYYKVFNENSNWQKAKEYCEIMDGHLVTITSQAEQNFVENLINSQCNRNNIWIGCYRDNNNTWRWVTGENFSYTHWASGRPDNYKNIQDKGMIMNKIHTGYFGTWDDIEADGGQTPRYGEENFSFICEWEFEEVSAQQLEVME